MLNDDIISMPDKWEYPWYAAWDLAFHMLPLAIVDHDFAKTQLDLMLRNDYLHPNGQLRPTNGILAMSTRLFMPTPPFRSIRWTRNATTARATSSF